MSSSQEIKDLIDGLRRLRDGMVSGVRKVSLSQLINPTSNVSISDSYMEGVLDQSGHVNLQNLEAKIEGLEKELVQVKAEEEAAKAPPPPPPPAPANADLFEVVASIVSDINIFADAQAKKLNTSLTTHGQYLHISGDKAKSISDTYAKDTKESMGKITVLGSQKSPQEMAYSLGIEDGTAEMKNFLYMMEHADAKTKKEFIEKTYHSAKNNAEHNTNDITKKVETQEFKSVDELEKTTKNAAQQSTIIYYEDASIASRKYFESHDEKAILDNKVFKLTSLTKELNEIKDGTDISAAYFDDKQTTEKRVEALKIDINALKSDKQVFAAFSALHPEKIEEKKTEVTHTEHTTSTKKAAHHNEPHKTAEAAHHTHDVPAKPKPEELKNLVKAQDPALLDLLQKGFAFDMQNMASGKDLAEAKKKADKIKEDNAPDLPTRKPYA